MVAPSSVAAAKYAGTITSLEEQNTQMFKGMAKFLKWQSRVAEFWPQNPHRNASGNYFRFIGEGNQAKP
jgi:hypothetical protein